MTLERTVGGLKCSEVLTHLSDYVDGEVEPDLKLAIETHLAGCDLCARFGGAFATVIQGLRDQLGARQGAELAPSAWTWSAIWTIQTP